MVMQQTLKVTATDTASNIHTVSLKEKGRDGLKITVKTYQYFFE